MTKRAATLSDQDYAQPPTQLLRMASLMAPFGPKCLELIIIFLFSYKANRTLVNYDPMDEIQIAEINSQVRRYLEGTLEEIDVRRPLPQKPPPSLPGSPCSCFAGLGIFHSTIEWVQCEAPGLGNPSVPLDSASLSRTSRLWVFSEWLTPFSSLSYSLNLVHFSGLTCVVGMAMRLA